MNIPLPTAPAALLADGQSVVEDGIYAGAIADLSTTAWDGKGGPLSARRLRRKGWLYVGLYSPRYMMGFAVVDAGLVASAFIYVYDRETGALHEENCVKPLGFASGFAPDWRGAWALQSRGREWRVDYDGKAWRLSFNSAAMQMSAEVLDHQRGISVVSSAPGRPFHHTYKLGGLAARVTLAGTQIAAVVEARASLDFSLGYPPRQTTWNWASLDGVTDDGQPLSLNLVAHFLNGLENVLWLGDQVLPLAQAIFHYVPDDPLAPWSIRTVDGLVALTFTPDGQRREHLNVGVLKSHFNQPFGRFEGVCVTAQGRRAIHGYGVVEAHQATW